VGNKIYKALVPWTEDKWIVAVEVKPGDPKAVHHGQVYLNWFGGLVTSYDPGIEPLILPPDTAFYFPANNHLQWFMHFTPYGKATTDRTKVGFKFWKGSKPPKHRHYTLDCVFTNVDIAPGDGNAPAENWLTLMHDTTVVGMLPHMHLRGKDFLCEVVYPDGKRETLLSVPGYSPFWQTTYRFKEPLQLPGKTKLRFLSHYDNSSSNPNNPDPKKRVRYGSQSWEEMQTVVLDCVEDNPPKNEMNYNPEFIPDPVNVVRQAQDTEASPWWFIGSVGGLLTLAAMFSLAKHRSRVNGGLPPGRLACTEEEIVGPVWGREESGIYSPWRWNQYDPDGEGDVAGS
jgi:hypothetical protein